jgi:hypothetical protein
VPPHEIPPYYTQPAYAAPAARASRIESRVLLALLASTVGIVLALIGLLFGAAALALQLPGLGLALWLGLPVLVLGPVGYFLGKSAVGRIATSEGALGGRSSAAAASVIGIVATALGATVSLVLLVLVLLNFFGTPPL